MYTRYMWHGADKRKWYILEEYETMAWWYEYAHIFAYDIVTEALLIHDRILNSYIVYDTCNDNWYD